MRHVIAAIIALYLAYTAQGKPTQSVRLTQGPPVTIHDDVKAPTTCGKAGCPCGCAEGSPCVCAVPSVVRASPAVIPEVRFYATPSAFVPAPVATYNPPPAYTYQPAPTFLPMQPFGGYGGQVQRMTPSYGSFGGAGSFANCGPRG